MGKPTSGSDEIREALMSASEPLSVAEIYALTTMISSTTAVAAFVNVETKAGRLTRSGKSGSYRYELPAAQRAKLARKGLAAADPDKISSIRQLIEKRKARPPIERESGRSRTTKAGTTTAPPAARSEPPASAQPTGKRKPPTPSDLPAIGQVLEIVAEIFSRTASDLRRLKASLEPTRPPGA